MLRRSDEAHYHNPPDVQDYLTISLGVLTACGLDPETHDATLAAVLNLLSSKQVVFEQVNPSVLEALR